MQISIGISLSIDQADTFSVSASFPHLLLEDGTFLLLETTDKILIE